MPLALIALPPWPKTLPTITKMAAARTALPNPKSNFGFLPADLSGKCRALIESYHAMHGFGGLPDMLWMSEARDIIEGDRDLTLAFTRACRSRGAKRANELVHRNRNHCYVVGSVGGRFRRLGQTISERQISSRESFRRPDQKATCQTNESLFVSVIGGAARVRRRVASSPVAAG